MPPNDLFRQIAPVKPITGRKQSVHSKGLLGASKEYMPFPEVVIIDIGPESCMVYRYRSDGTFCGDTWHQTIEEAKAQCAHEYGGALGEWLIVPRTAENVRDCAVKFLISRPEA